MDLSYTKLNNSKLLVKGDKNKYDAVVKAIGGRWSNIVAGGPGWVFDPSKEEQIKRFLKELNVPSRDEEKTKKTFDELKNNIKSRKGQNKFHRSISSDKPKEIKEIEEYYGKFKKTPPKEKHKKKSTPPEKKSYYSSDGNSNDSYDSDSSGFPSESSSENSSESSSENSSDSPDKEKLYKKINDLNKEINKLKKGKK